MTPVLHTSNEAKISLPDTNPQQAIAKHSQRSPHAGKPEHMLAEQALRWRYILQTVETTPASLLSRTGLFLKSWAIALLSRGSEELLRWRKGLLPRGYFLEQARMLPPPHDIRERLAAIHARHAPIPRLADAPEAQALTTADLNELLP